MIYYFSHASMKIEIKYQFIEVRIIHILFYATILRYFSTQQE